MMPVALHSYWSACSNQKASRHRGLRLLYLPATSCIVLQVVARTGRNYLSVARSLRVGPVALQCLVSCLKTWHLIEMERSLKEQTVICFMACFYRLSERVRSPCRTVLDFRAIYFMWHCYKKSSPRLFVGFQHNSLTDSAVA